MKQRIVRVGLDLDGVILYNPARISRRTIAGIKRLMFPQKELRFFYPKTPFLKFLWTLLHKSSLFVAPGFTDIVELAKKKRIKLYIITARYSFLKDGFLRFIKKIQRSAHLAGYFYNKNNDQPHLFKEKMIRTLKLDVFVEDNWDIVNHLASKQKKTLIVWIYNIFDRAIMYHPKVPDLKRAATLIQKTFMVSKPKILIATDYFFPHWTGISKSLVYGIDALKDIFRFTVLTVRHKHSLKKKERLHDVNIIREDPLFSLSRAYLSFSIILRFFIEAKNHDVIFINSPHSHIFFFSLMGKLLGKTVFIFHQGDLILPKGLLNRAIETLYNISAYGALLFADQAATYTSDYAKHSRVLKPFLNKCAPLLFPIPKPKYTKTTMLPILIALKKQKKVLFGFAGRFVEEKGFDILFDAIPYVVQEIPDARFIFAGETHMKYEYFFEKQVEKLKKIKQYVVFLGLLGEKHLAEFYNWIDFIVVPSRSDCFSLVQAEAMLSKKPAIVADIPGARFLVRETGFGMLFEKENAHDLAQKIVASYRQKESIAQQYKNVLELLDSRRNAKTMRECIEGLYKKSSYSK